MDTSLNNAIEKTYKSFGEYVQEIYSRSAGERLSVCLSLNCGNGHAPIIIEQTLTNLVDNREASICCIHGATKVDALDPIFDKHHHTLLITTEQSIFSHYQSKLPVLLLRPEDASVLETSRNITDCTSMNTVSIEKNSVPLSTRIFTTSGSTGAPKPLTFLYHEHLWLKNDDKQKHPKSHGLCASDFTWVAKLLSCTNTELVDSVCIANVFPMNTDAAFSTIQTYKAVQNALGPGKATYRQFTLDEVYNNPNTITELLIQKIEEQSKAIKGNKPLPLLALYLSPINLANINESLDEKLKQDPSFKDACQKFFACIFTTGSSCDPEDISNFSNLCPYVVFLNGYGPTEIIYGLPPKAYCSQTAINTHFPNLNQEDNAKFLDYCTSSSIWPESSAKKQNQWTFTFPIPYCSANTNNAYQTLFLKALHKLVPPDRPYHSVEKEEIKEIYKILNKPEVPDQYAITINVARKAFTDEEMNIRTAPYSFRTGDICRVTNDNILTWMEGIEVIKGPNVIKITIKEYTKYLSTALSSAFTYNGKFVDTNAMVFCHPLPGQGIVTFIIESNNPDEKMDTDIIECFLKNIRKEPAPCPEEFYIVPINQISNLPKLTNNYKPLSNEHAVRQVLMKQLTDSKLNENFSNGTAKRFIPGLHGLQDKSLPTGWKSVFPLVDLTKSELLPSILDALITTADNYLPNEMKIFDLEKTNTLIPDVTLMSLGIDSHSITVFCASLIDKLETLLDSDFSKKIDDLFLPDESNQNISTSKLLFESLISSKIAATKTLSELAEIIAETLLINPIPIGISKKQNAVPLSESGIKLSKFNNSTSHAPKAVVIACSDITGTASWATDKNKGLFHKLAVDSNTVDFYTLSLPYLLTSDVNTLKRALRTVCNPTIGNIEAKVYVIGFSSGGIIALLLKEIFPAINFVTLLDSHSPDLIFKKDPTSEPGKHFKTLYKKLFAHLTRSEVQNAPPILPTTHFPQSDLSQKVRSQDWFLQWRKCINQSCQAFDKKYRLYIKSIWLLFLTMSRDNHEFSTTDNVKLLVAEKTWVEFSNQFQLGFKTGTPIESINHNTDHLAVPMCDQVIKHVSSQMLELLGQSDRYSPHNTDATNDFRPPPVLHPHEHKSATSCQGSHRDSDKVPSNPLPFPPTFPTHIFHHPFIATQYESFVLSQWHRQMTGLGDINEEPARKRPKLSGHSLFKPTREASSENNEYPRTKSAPPPSF